MADTNSIPLLLIVLAIVAGGILCAGCTSRTTGPPVQVTTPVPVGTTYIPATTPLPTVSITTPVVTGTGSIGQDVPDATFLNAYAASKDRILALLTSINVEVQKDGVQGNNAHDYTPLVSYGRQLGDQADKEIQAMGSFREFSEPSNEELQKEYIAYLSGLKPFAGNIEAAGGLAQKRNFVVAKDYFTNAKNDLGILRNLPIPEHRVVINQISSNMGALIDVLDKASLPMNNS